MNFRDLVTSKAAYRDPGVKPRSFARMATKCGISRAHLYALFGGLKSAQAYTVVKIARGLLVPPEDVEIALEVSRREALAS